jgi:hypothetical protein
VLHRSCIVSGEIRARPLLTSPQLPNRAHGGRGGDCAPGRSGGGRPRCREGADGEVRTSIKAAVRGDKAGGRARQGGAHPALIVACRGGRPALSPTVPSVALASPRHRSRSDQVRGDFGVRLTALQLRRRWQWCRQHFCKPSLLHGALNSRECRGR